VKWKNVAFIALLIITASAFVVTSSMPELVGSDGSPDVIGFIKSIGRPVFALCDPVPGGPGGGGD